MAKTKTPFLSLTSHGSIAGAITTQSTAGGTIIRSKPKPTDRYSPAQAYQRWLYYDYAYLWTKQTTNTKRTYSANGSHHHLTGFQYWMKVMLTTMPDIMGLWKLDEKSGAVALDSGRKGNNGIITGASPTKGTINGAQFFDGLNDTVNFGTPPSITLTEILTYEFFYRCDRIRYNDTLLANGAYNTGGWYLWMDVTTIQLNITKTGSTQWFGAPLAWATGTTYHITLQIDNPSLRAHIFINGDLLVTFTLAWPFQLPTSRPLFLGGYWFSTRNTEGYFDHLIGYNRLLDATEIKRHSQRRYPA